MKRPFNVTALLTFRHSAGRATRLHSKVESASIDATSIQSARKLAALRFANAASVTIEPLPTGIPAAQD